jgi:hypothetical protein
VPEVVRSHIRDDADDRVRFFVSVRSHMLPKRISVGLQKRRAVLAVTIATRGVPAPSTFVNSRPRSNRIPISRKYSAETKYSQSNRSGSPAEGT